MPSGTPLENPGDIVMDAIIRAARTNSLAPSNETLCTLIGARSWSTAARVVQQLEQAGLIEVTRFNAARVITVPSLGISTAAPPLGSGSRGGKLRAPPPPPDLETCIAREAARLGEPVPTFRARLMWLGWECHVEACHHDAA